MSAPVLIVGQGLAGTLVARICEQRGRAFVIVDAGHGKSASRIGAGIINPVTGKRLVKTVGIDRDLPIALTTYREWETLLKRPILTALRVRRQWVSNEERGWLADRVARGELVPYVDVEAITDTGFEIAPAWRVDTAGLIAAARERWRASGQLREATVTRDDAKDWAGPVIWCDGAGGTPHGLPLTVAAGAIGVISAAVNPAIILNRGGRWLLPVDNGRAWVGATYSSGDAVDQRAAAVELTQLAQQLTGDWSIGLEEVRTGLRMVGRDRRPLSDWLPGRAGREGCLNGLGSKGALWAPRLAMEWGARLA